MSKSVKTAKFTEKTQKSQNAILQVIKAVVIAIIFSLVFVLASAFAIKIFNVQSNIIPVINQFIKGISVLLGCVFCLRGSSNGWVKGLFVGILYTVLGFFVFSFLDGALNINLTLLNDVAVSSISGILSGIIAANLK